jgi:hypothetical protein
LLVGIALWHEASFAPNQSVGNNLLIGIEPVRYHERCIAVRHSDGRWSGNH